MRLGIVYIAYGNDHIQEGLNILIQKSHELYQPSSITVYLLQNDKNAERFNLPEQAGVTIHQVEGDNTFFDFSEELITPIGFTAGEVGFIPKNSVSHKHAHGHIMLFHTAGNGLLL